MRIGMSALAAIALAGSMLSFPAMAQRPYGLSYIYLDSQSNIIGQTIATCDNKLEHAGVVNHLNPYSVVLSVTCDITQAQNVGVTHFSPADPGLTVDFFCNGSHPLGTPFHGAPICIGAVLQRSTTLGPWLPGTDDTE